MVGEHRQRRTPETPRVYCPKCRSRMLPRQNDEGVYFYGCKLYPKCKGSLSIEDARKQIQRRKEKTAQQKAIRKAAKKRRRSKKKRLQASYPTVPHGSTHEAAVPGAEYPRGCKDSVA